MEVIREMLSRHPKPAASPEPTRECIEACIDCFFACIACADACLAESHLEALRACIRRNLDCADLCDMVAKALSWQTASDGAIVRLEVEACAALCNACAVECERHAKEHQHCRVCAEQVSELRIAVPPAHAAGRNQLMLRGRSRVLQ